MEQLEVTRGGNNHTLPKGTGETGEARTPTNTSQAAQKLEESGMKAHSNALGERMLRRLVISVIKL